MEKQVIILNAKREGYSIDQVRGTMTVGQLIAELEQFDEDLPIYLSHDDGYTYGSIRAQYFDDLTIDDEEQK